MDYMTTIGNEDDKESSIGMPRPTVYSQEDEFDHPIMRQPIPSFTKMFLFGNGLSQRQSYEALMGSQLGTSRKITRGLTVSQIRRSKQDLQEESSIRESVVRQQIMIRNQTVRSSNNGLFSARQSQSKSGTNPLSGDTTNSRLHNNTSSAQVSSINEELDDEDSEQSRKSYQ